MISHAEMMKFAGSPKVLGVATSSGGEAPSCGGVSSGEKVASSGGVMATMGGMVTSSGGVVASSCEEVAFSCEVVASGGGVPAVTSIEMSAFRTYAKVNRFKVGVELGQKGEKLKQELVKRSGRFSEI